MKNSADTTDEQKRVSAHLADIFERIAPLKLDPSSILLYDPSTIKRRQGNTAATANDNTALLANVQSFPKLLAAGSDDHYENHHSYEIVQALSSHSTKMHSLDEEWNHLNAEDQTFHGKNSEQLAKAFQSYGTEHQGQGLPDSYIKAVEGNSLQNGAVNSGSNKTSITSFASNIAPMSATIPITMSALDPSTFSWAALLKSMNWARILYTIVWITTGLTLLFFGYASFFWLHKVGLSRGNHSTARPKGIGGKLSRIFSLNNEPQRSTIDSSASAAAKRRKAQKKRALVGGGIGGILVGFLFFSYLAAVINNAICVDDGKKSLSAGAYFAVWLAPGLLGAMLAGHFAFLARAMTGVLGGTTFTIVLTAVFGIKTMLIRMILLAIFTLSFTIPLIQPKAKVIQMMILNACTSLIGMVTFLNGVALVAPSVEASSNWLDLWTVLCMHKDENAQSVLENAWHTSTFKGYIAGAILGSVVGFLFELFFHRHCGHDPESEWNQYLGTYTQHMESGRMPGESSATLYDDPKYNNSKAQIGAVSPRAGMFEPAPNAWQRMADFFDSDRSKPAHYGGLSGDGTLHESLTGGAITSVGERIRRKRSAKTTRSGGPARFERLSKRDENEDDFNSDTSDDDDEKERLHNDDEDDEKTDVEGSDDERRANKHVAFSGLVPTLDKDSNSATVNYGGYALPRPPMLTTTSTNSGTSVTSGQVDSRLTGTTAASGSSSSTKGSDAKVHKPVGVYHDGNASPPSNPTIPATPSLINAISRIQFAQQQARAWQQQHEAQGTPYAGATSPPTSPPPHKPSK
ncbi:uncharacterized protein FA14DRAFT_169948 [Meira miltonrushii]|uniref:DUF4203 domain-containing protein n=1 Tax=Meira miltonrushii TaxID=1280837 RepID=A0A316VHC1_9BASI|nr:uncharacterized protein FA14DRAFT_169948 [Meira miltonrushii]PWN37057.1 hypothetical protein FA14DRAFT_169948 [Meira miltonrushii]